MKKTFRNKKAFTLIELLIVIAIIGILFIVLVSKVDFATDKAKATGVQTDFRSYQVALEQVAKENAGFNTFGWDVCDLNGNRVRDSYDVGDINQNGKQDEGEVFTGRKEYGEEFAGIYTLTNPADTSDMSAVRALEAAINANLDPKLHLVIHDDFTITMATQATDPWKNEYHGRYQSNAGADGMDRGAIFLYSKGANGDNGSADGIVGGLVNITTPQNNITGQDDYVLATFYSYANGYGEVQTVTKGFSQNQTFNDGSNVPVTPSVDPPIIPGYLQPVARKNKYGLWLNRAYQVAIEQNEETGESITLDFIFKDNGGVEIFLGAKTETMSISLPIHFLLVLEGLGSNMEEAMALLENDLFTYTMDENGLMFQVNPMLGDGALEIETIQFDPVTQQLALYENADDEEPAFTLSLTDVKNGNIHMFNSYESLDESIVPDIKPYPDGSWIASNGVEMGVDALYVVNHIVMVESNGQVLPLGFTSIDGKDIFIALDGDGLIGSDGNGNIVPTWSVNNPK